MQLDFDNLKHMSILCVSLTKFSPLEFLFNNEIKKPSGWKNLDSEIILLGDEETKALIGSILQWLLFEFVRKSFLIFSCF